MKLKRPVCTRAGRAFFMFHIGIKNAGFVNAEKYFAIYLHII
jgi:hypothetical protein